jgi:hypothetical protein
VRVGKGGTAFAKACSAGRRELRQLPSLVVGIAVARDQSSLGEILEHETGGRSVGAGQSCEISLGDRSGLVQHQQKLELHECHADRVRLRGIDGCRELLGAADQEGQPRVKVGERYPVWLHHLRRSTTPAPVAVQNLGLRHASSPANGRKGLREGAPMQKRSRQ